jgi:hypothetical protein
MSIVGIELLSLRSRHEERVTSARCRIHESRLFSCGTGSFRALLARVPGRARKQATGARQWRLEQRKRRSEDLIERLGRPLPALAGQEAEMVACGCRGACRPRADESPFAVTDQALRDEESCGGSTPRPGCGHG